jgi:hypothetical protein
MREIKQRRADEYSTKEKIREQNDIKERGHKTRMGNNAEKWEKDCPLFQTSEPPELSEWVTAGQALPCYVLFTAFPTTRLTSHVARQ